MWILRALIIILSFTIEVRVKAAGKKTNSGLDSKNYYLQPANCLKQDSACSVVAKTGHFHFNKNMTQIHAIKSSILKRETATSWNLISGVIWIQSSQTLDINTVYAKIQGANLNFWVVQKPKKIIYRNLSNASLKLTLKNAKHVDVPAGFQVWVGLDEDHSYSHGMIEPIEAVEHLAFWKDLYQGNKQSFLSEVESFKELLKQSKEQSSELYRDVVLREIASIEEKKQLEAKEKARQKAQKEKIRNLYFQKVFEE